ncbi:hypothetical protein [Janibacter terrae]|uniref:hypothetical protein n=1 Tax=Janibacter terrae TaxID=103817 RepID=UPI0031F938EC
MSENITTPPPPTYAAKAAPATAEPDEAPGMAAALLAEDVREKTEKPEGSPSFIPAAGLPRRTRADFFQAIRSINLAQAEQMQAKAEGDGPGVSMADAADAYEMLACMEEAMAIVVVPGAGAAYRRWCSQATDGDIGQLFGWYMNEMNPGEAQPSPTS